MGGRANAPAVERADDPLPTLATLPGEPGTGGRPNTPAVLRPPPVLPPDDGGGGLANGPAVDRCLDPPPPPPPLPPLLTPRPPPRPLCRPLSDSEALSADTEPLLGGGGRANTPAVVLLWPALPSSEPSALPRGEGRANRPAVLVACGDLDRDRERGEPPPEAVRDRPPRLKTEPPEPLLLPRLADSPRGRENGPAVVGPLPPPASSPDRLGVRKGVTGEAPLSGLSAPLSVNAPPLPGLIMPPGLERPSLSPRAATDEAVVVSRVESRREAKLVRRPSRGGAPARPPPPPSPPLPLGGFPLLL